MASVARTEEANELHASGALFARQIEPEPAPEDPVDWAMAEASDDEDDAPTPDAPPEPELIDMLQRLHARCRTWSAASHCAWCTALDRVDVSQKNATCIISHHALCCLTCPLSRVFVLCVLPRIPESDKKVSFFFEMASKSVDTR